MGTGDCNQSPEINGSRAFIEQFSLSSPFFLFYIFFHVFFHYHRLLLLLLVGFFSISFREEKTNDSAIEGLIPLTRSCVDVVALPNCSKLIHVGAELIFQFFYMNFVKKIIVNYLVVADYQ